MIDTQTLRAVAGYPGTSKETLIMFLLKAADEIDRLKRGEWISVKERLPEIGDTVLVISRLGDQSVATFDGDAFVDHHGIGAVIKYFTHWMPLPEPPKEGENG